MNSGLVKTLPFKDDRRFGAILKLTNIKVRLIEKSYHFDIMPFHIKYQNFMT